MILISIRTTVYSWCCHYNFCKLFTNCCMIDFRHLYDYILLWIFITFHPIIAWYTFFYSKKRHDNTNLYNYRKVWSNDDISKPVTGKYVFERIFPASSIIEYLKTVKSPDKNNHGKSCRIYVSHQNWSILPWNKRIKKAGSCHRGYCSSSG